MQNRSELTEKAVKAIANKVKDLFKNDEADRKC